MKKVLTIAGSDIFAGGGLQADLATFSQLNTAGLAAVTCIATVKDQFELHPLATSLVQEQLASLAAVPLDAIKLGLLLTEETVTETKKFLKSQTAPVITDPVFAFKESKNWQENGLARAIVTELFPVTTITTPNLAEAEILAAMPIKSVADMKAAALKIQRLGPKVVVIKGGNRLAGEQAVDLIFDGTFTLLEEEKLPHATVNGAGCTFAAAITAEMAKGATAIEAITFAKKFVHAAIRQGYIVSPGFGNVWPNGWQTEEAH